MGEAVNGNSPKMGVLQRMLPGYQHLNKQYNLHVGGVCIVVYRTYSNILELTSDYFDFNIVPGRLPLYSRILLEHYTSKKIAAPS